MAQLVVQAAFAVAGGYAISGGVLAVGGGLTLGAKLGWFAGSCMGDTLVPFASKLAAGSISEPTNPIGNAHDDSQHSS